jgi:choline-sulfatase
MSDQHRGDAMSCAGHPVVRTPALDGIAAQGCRFTRAYTTSPLCMPARASLAIGATITITAW